MTDWNLLAGSASAIVDTPCFVMSERILRGSMAKLQGLASSVPLRHWLSLKTQPVPRLVEEALKCGFGVEVVSEFELDAALRSGVPPARLLVNGVGKQHWLLKHRVHNLTVHFDSLAEVRELAYAAKALEWRVGLRCAIPQAHAGHTGREPTEWDQFGMTREELQIAAAPPANSYRTYQPSNFVRVSVPANWNAVAANARSVTYAPDGGASTTPCPRNTPAGTPLLTEADTTIAGLHFHLHTNVQQASDYRRAVESVVEAAETARIELEYIDIGGGLPSAGEASGSGLSAASTFDFEEFGDVLQSIPSIAPSVREIWLENGRFLTGSAGALVVTVLDKKERGGWTYLICDGGRTNHARLAATETHDLVLDPQREGPLKQTIVCGPTCGAVDRLGCWMLPESLAPGHRIIWLNAGAYHIPLETRFSFGLAPLVWFDEKDRPEVLRERETPSQWWNQWTSSASMTADLCG
jgi:diaminopimelate decarboxylase